MAEQRPAPSSSYEDVQEHFTDAFETHINPWSAAITFGLRATRPTDENVYSVRMRMPLQLAKALAVLLLRAIRQYEQQTGADIDLPRQVLEGLNIPVEDWERFKGA